MRRLLPLLGLAVLWLVSSLACGSFAPRPTTPAAVVEETDVPTLTPVPQTPPMVTATPTTAEESVTIESGEEAPALEEPEVVDEEEPTTEATPTEPEPTATFTPAPEPETGIRVGQPARVVASGGINMRSQASPGAELVTQVSPGAQVQVVDGPVNADGLRWWRVETDTGHTGWVAEGDGENRWLSHELGEPRPVNRALRQGDTVQVTLTGGRTLSVRSSAGVNATLIRRVDSGTRFQVIGGPINANGLRWWQITRSDLTGWAAEGDGSERWLTPLE